MLPQSPFAVSFMRSPTQTFISGMKNQINHGMGSEREEVNAALIEPVSHINRFYH
jgi:hypothetical protein